MVLPFVGCALLAAEAPAPVAVLGAALYLLATALLFRGQVYGSAVFVGLVAGAAPMLAPILFRACHTTHPDDGLWREATIPMDR